MESLRQVIEQGQYELAAHRLLYGVVQAYLQQRGVEEGLWTCGSLAVEPEHLDDRTGVEPDGRSS